MSLTPGQSYSTPDPACSECEPEYQHLLTITEEFFTGVDLPQSLDKLIMLVIYQARLAAISGHIACAPLAYDGPATSSLIHFCNEEDNDALSPFDKGLLFSHEFIRVFIVPTLPVDNPVLSSRQVALVRWWKRLVSLIYQSAYTDSLTPLGRKGTLLIANNLVKEYVCYLKTLPQEVTDSIDNLNEVLDDHASNVPDIRPYISKFGKSTQCALIAYYYSRRAREYIANSSSSLETIFSDLTATSDTTSDKPKNARKAKSRDTFLDLSDL